MSIVKHKPAMGKVAGGNHLVADCDEPERMAFSESDWVQFDCERNVDKGQKLAARNDAQALAAQIMDLDAMRRAGWI